jgi:hypothetical protein
MRCDDLAMQKSRPSRTVLLGIDSGAKLFSEDPTDTIGRAPQIGDSANGHWQWSNNKPD